jgi:hypothetical protein
MDTLTIHSPICAGCFSPIREGERADVQDGQPIHWACFVPTTIPTGSREDFMVAPPNARNVTPKLA